MDNQQQNEQPNQEPSMATTAPEPPIVPPQEHQPQTPATPPAEPDKPNGPLIMVLIILIVSMLLFVVGACVANPYLVKIRELAAEASESGTEPLADNTVTGYGTTDSSPNNYGPTTDDKQAAEKAIRDFFALLNEKKFTEAVDSMSRNTINSETVRQQWISGLSNLSLINIETLEEIDPDTWINSTPQYHILFKASYKPTTTPKIFDEGENNKYIFVINEDGIKKVHSFQTTTDTIF